MTDNTAIEFVANAIYVAEERERGYQPWAWKVLNPEDRKKYVLQAHDLVSNWVDGEKEKEASRQSMLEPTYQPRGGTQ